MEKETITMLAQILTSMKDSVTELDKAQKSKDAEKVVKVKSEIINLKNQIDKLL